VLFEQYWVEAGTAPLPDPDVPDEFVLTPSVRRHLATLARAVLLRKHPILLQARVVCCVVCARERRFSQCHRAHSGAPETCDDAKHSSD
jgi:hypothetical protein